MTRKRMGYKLSVLAATLLLAGLVARRASYPAPVESGTYLAEVRADVKDLPETFGAWRGEDAPVPTAAITLLRPNAALSRRYVNTESGTAFQLWVVHCGDARDMAGHYPPVCYPNSGWSQEGSREVQFEPENDLPGMEYTFSQMIAGRNRQLVVANLILLPNGQPATTLEDLRELESDYRNRYRGAAQLQFVFDASVGEGARERAIGDFLAQTQTQPLMSLLRGATL